MTTDELKNEWHYPREDNDYPNKGEKVIIEFHTGWIGEVVFEDKNRWEDKKGNVFTSVTKWRYNKWN